MPGEPSGRSTTSSNTPFHRLNDRAANRRPNNGCVSRDNPHLTRQHRTQLLQSVAFTPGTGKTHLAIGLAMRACHAGHRVLFATAADLVETLYRGLADNTVGKIIESLLRVDLIILDELGFAPLDDTGTQLLFRLVAGAYERRSLAVGSHWPFEQWGRFLPEQTTAVSILDRLLHHATVVITNGTQTVLG